MLQTAEDFQVRLAAIDDLPAPDPEELATQRARLEQIRTAKQEAVKIRLANQVASPYHKLLAYVLHPAEEYAKLIDEALELDRIINFDERMWQLALIGCLVKKRNLESVALIGRSLGDRRQLARIARIVWPPTLAERCNKVLDDLADQMETISLGLNADFTKELLRRVESEGDPGTPKA